jgi:beta-phosphoglucomutase-like phosphatase (HAD superfamily)
MKTIIFDCDGPLVDSEVLSNEVRRSCLETRSVMSVDEAAFRGSKCIGSPRTKLRHEVRKPHEVDASIPAEVIVLNDLLKLRGLLAKSGCPALGGRQQSD